jgi:hypothetical protein
VFKVLSFILFFFLKITLNYFFFQKNWLVLFNFSANTLIDLEIILRSPSGLESYLALSHPKLPNAALIVGAISRVVVPATYGPRFVPETTNRSLIAAEPCILLFIIF